MRMCCNLTAGNGRCCQNSSCRGILVGIEWKRHFMRRSLALLSPWRAFPKMAEKSATAVTSTFRCATFNILAPCYNRVRGWWAAWESSQPNLYMKRYEDIITLLAQEPQLDAICLQEFWFNNDAQELFENMLGERYRILKLKRQGYKTDGLAILVHRSSSVIRIQSLNFDDYGNRVALLLHVLLPNSGQEVVLASTHISYCHNIFDEYIRMSQAKKVVKGIDSYLHKNNLDSTPVVLAGDFNSPQDNPVYKFMGENGFLSSYKDVHGKEPSVTHRDHRGNQLSVDYIFYRNSANSKIVPKSSVVLPQQYSDKVWPEEFNISDHRMIVTEFELNSPTDK